jgi:hypothetical protein
MVGASHTHSGGPTCDCLGSRAEKWYCDLVGRQIGTAIVEANRLKRPATLSLGRGYEDSVAFNRSKERTWEAGGGVAMRLPGQRGTWGIEYHWVRGLLEQTTSGTGPRPTGWDLRTGLEYRWMSTLTGRVGYMYRWEDRDAYTKQNEYLGNTITLGLGLRPAGASWTIESGYAIEWLQADYGTPAEPRASRQQLASMVRWVF